MKHNTRSSPWNEMKKFQQMSRAGKTKGTKHIIWYFKQTAMIGEYMWSWLVNDATNILSQEKPECLQMQKKQMLLRL